MERANITRPLPLPFPRAQNLLIDDSNLCLKIADLGLGRAFSIPVKSYTHEVGRDSLVAISQSRSGHFVLLVSAGLHKHGSYNANYRLSA